MNCDVNEDRLIDFNVYTEKHNLYDDKRIANAENPITFNFKWASVHLMQLAAHLMTEDLKSDCD